LQASSDDYLSKIADTTVVNLGQLLLDNINVVRNLDKPLTGRPAEQLFLAICKLAGDVIIGTTVWGAAFNLEGVGCVRELSCNVYEMVRCVCLGCLLQD
jgi:hypothetical protein